MPNLEWNDISDWDSNQDSTGINHNNDPYTDSSPGKIKQGYQKQWPPMTHGLVGWWPLHTDNPVDLSGNGNHGTKNGGVTTGVAGKGGLQAYSFDGSDDSIQITDFSFDIAGTDGYTASMWVKIDSLPNSGDLDWITRWWVDSSNNWGLILDDTSMRYNWSNGNITTTSISTDVWYHVVMTVTSNGNATSYLNGSVVGTSSVDSAVGTTDIILGAESSTAGIEQHSDCTISGFRLYDRALSQSEIQTLYEWGSADTANSPQDGAARYKLDGNANDAWNDNDGTNNGVKFADDAIRGQSGKFVASDSDYITASSMGVTSPLTVSAWVKTTDGSTVRIACGEYGSNGERFAIVANAVAGGEWSVYLDDGSSASHYESSGSSFDSGSWVLLTAALNGSEVHLYENASLNAVHSYSGGEVSPSGPFDIGRQAGNDAYYWNGLIDDVRIYDYALTPEEVFELYRYGTRGINMNKYTVMQ